MEVSAVNYLKGEVTIPGDKSISHRAAIISSLTKKPVHIKNFLFSQDCINTLNILESLGIKIEKNDDGVTVYGKGINGLIEPDDILYVGNSGTTIRLMSGILSGAGITAVLSGDESINERPMGRIIEPLRQMGANIFGRHNNLKAPIIILPSNKLTGKQFNVPVSSAQVKSCIIFAGLFAEGNTEIIQPEVSRDHTERMLEFFGADISYDGRYTKIVSGSELIGKNLYIPGDLSSGLYFLIASLIVPASHITIKNLGINPTRKKILDLLIEMGANIKIGNKRSVNNEDIADIDSYTSKLNAVKIDKSIIPNIIDEIPAFCVAAACADGETIIEGAQELRHKESDRIHSIYNEFLKAGVNIRQNPDGLSIIGDSRFRAKGGTYYSYDDHRIAMSLAVLGLRADETVKILDSRCIETSFPDFLYELKRVIF